MKFKIDSFREETFSNIFVGLHRMEHCSWHEGPRSRGRQGLQQLLLAQLLELVKVDEF